MLESLKVPTVVVLLQLLLLLWDLMMMPPLLVEQTRLHSFPEVKHSDIHGPYQLPRSHRSIGLVVLLYFGGGSSFGVAPPAVAVRDGDEVTDKEEWVVDINECTLFKDGDCLWPAR